MSDSDMGSLLDASPPVVVEDVDDVPPSSVCIDIEGGGPSTATSADVSAVTAADLSLLDEKFSLLLAAHSREAATVSARMDALEVLKLGSLMAEAAKNCAESAAAATAAMAAAKEVMTVLSDTDFIQSEIEERAPPSAHVSPQPCTGVDPHPFVTTDARNAAFAIRDTVVSASSEAAAAVSADVKKAARKR